MHPIPIARNGEEGSAAVQWKRPSHLSSPALNRLRELGPQLEAIVRELDGVRAQQRDLAAAVAKGQSEAASATAHAHAAQQSASLSESARQALLATIAIAGDNREVRRGGGRPTAPAWRACRALARCQYRARCASGQGPRRRAFDRDLPALARETTELLSATRSKLGELDEAVGKSRTQMGAAATSAQAAQLSAEQAEKSRTLAGSAVEGILKDVGEQKRALGYTQRSVEVLNQEIADLRTKVAVAPPDLAPLGRRLDELGKQIDTVAKQVKTIEEKLGSPPPTYPKSEVELTPPQISAIQQRLADLGFDPKGADGKIGDNTRGAIKAFQRSIGQPVTGTPTAPRPSRSST